MKNVSIYGIKTGTRDQKRLITQVNTYLESRDRTTSKSTSTSAYKPYEISHYYWNLNRSLDTWLDIYPNVDKRGAFFYPEHSEYAWLMHVRLNGGDSNRDSAVNYISSLIEYLDFEVSLLLESDDLDNGLKRGLKCED